jgi:hypothetical protein
MQDIWMQWIAENWRALRAKQRLTVPDAWLPHPQFVNGFKRVRGWPAGQLCDWGLSLDDGSRIHVQCFRRADRTETLVAHRDRWDPTVDAATAVMHLVFETPAGPVLGLAALTTVAGVVVSRV